MIDSTLFSRKKQRSLSYNHIKRNRAIRSDKSNSHGSQK